MISGERGGQIYPLRPIHFTHQIIAPHYRCRHKETYISCLSLYQQTVKVYEDVKLNPIVSALTGSEWLALRSGALYTYSNEPLSVEWRKNKRYSECDSNK
jgi:hypothetical protein